MAAIATQTHSLFNWQVRVYYEDTDSGGVVYHSNYLKFLERARTEWLRNLGFEHTYLNDAFNVIFVVHSMQIEFKKPAKFNELLTITSELGKVGRGSFEFVQKVLKNNQLLVQAQVKLACVSMLTFKPVAVPKPLLQKIESQFELKKRS